MPQKIFLHIIHICIFSLIESITYCNFPSSKVLSVCLQNAQENILYYVCFFLTFFDIFLLLQYLFSTLLQQL